MKRCALLLVFCFSLVLSKRGVAAVGPDVVHDLLKQSDAATASGKWDDVIKLNEQVISAHPEGVNSWFTAEMNIAKALTKKGDLPGALQAAHVCLDGALTPQAFDSAVTFAAQVMSAEDKSVDRANQFITFEQQGGTTNPMDSVGYPAMPDREKAFATMRLQAGDDAAASRLRAFTCLFIGKPKDALAQFAEAFRRSDNNSDVQHAASDLVCIGLRDMRGHRVGLGADLQFVIYGPNGPDGKPGTPDDIADPFAAYLSPPPPPGEGGLSGVDPGALAPLRQVYDAARLYAGEPLLLEEMRHPALLALTRATSALDGWGAPGQEDWYLDLALGRHGMPRATPGSGAMLIAGAEWAARGRGDNLGAIDAVWQTVDADSAAKNLPLDKNFERVRTQFNALRTALGRISLPKPSLKPLTAPASF